MSLLRYAARLAQYQPNEFKISRSVDVPINPNTI